MTSNVASTAGVTAPLFRKLSCAMPGSAARWSRSIPLLLLLAPAYLHFLVFTLYPLLQGLGLSLYDADLATRTFVGFDNFVDLANDRIFLRAVTNTLLFAAIIAPTTLALALWIAVTVYPLGPAWHTFFRLAFYLPVVGSGVVLTLVWVWLYSPVHSPLAPLIGGPVLWLASTRTALPAVAVAVIAWSIGGPVIYFMAALENQPPELYEAALVDGATTAQSFWHVTLPLLRPVILFVLVTQTISAIQLVVVVLILTHGGPAYATETILTRLYRVAFEFHRLGYASAMAVVLALAAGVLTLAQFRWLGRGVEA